MRRAYGPPFFYQDPGRFDDNSQLQRQTQFTRHRTFRQPDWHHHRVLRLLYLRDRRRAGLPQAVLPRFRRRRRDPAVAGDLRPGLPGAPDRFGRVRPLRRPRGPQGDPGGGPADHGLSTVVIGMLPTYATIGTVAPLLLALCRFGQGLGLGGEWGGAVLLATENAPPGKRAWYGMFPQLGAPIGFFLSGGTFLLLTQVLTESEFFAYGWRIPFLASALLVIVGMYVRLKLTETPDFARVLAKNERVKIPVVTVLRDHTRVLVLGTLIALCTFVLFYLMTVFTLSWGTSKLGFSRKEFLILQLFA